MGHMRATIQVFRDNAFRMARLQADHAAGELARDAELLRSQVATLIARIRSA